MADPATWMAVAAVTAVTGLGYSVYSGERSYEAQKDAEKKQEQAIAAAEAKQAEADEKAEKKRLEALAAQQGGDTGRTSKFDFGIDSAAAKTTAPVTIATTTTSEDDEDYNPFYARGTL